jgi:hypothetical protein
LAAGGQFLAGRRSIFGRRWSIFGWAAAVFSRLRPVFSRLRQDLGKSGGWKGGFWAKAAGFIMFSGFGADGVRAKNPPEKNFKKRKIFIF